MTRIPTAVSAAATTVVALATRAPGAMTRISAPVAMTRISAPVAKATVASALPVTTAVKGLPLMPMTGRGAMGLVPALVATPAIRVPLVEMRMPATVAPEAIRRV